MGICDGSEDKPQIKNNVITPIDYMNTVNNEKIVNAKVVQPVITKEIQPVIIKEIQPVHC